MLKPAIWCLVAWWMAAGVAMAAAPSCALVPGWTQAGAARVYSADNLFEYMDGNSEGYLLYNFQEMRGVTCEKGGVTFVIDVSDMGDADFAYGMFTATRDLRQPECAVGMGGQIVPRRMLFAKGKFYVEIAANPEGDHSAALREFAAALEKAVPGETSLPAAFGWFPKEGLQSLRLVPESVLGLRVLRSGYVAQYEFGKAFVVEDGAAAEVMEKLKARFPGGSAVSIGDAGYEATDKYLGHLTIFRKGRFVGGYALSGDRGDGRALGAALAEKVR